MALVKEVNVVGALAKTQIGSNKSTKLVLTYIGTFF